MLRRSWGMRAFLRILRTAAVPDACARAQVGSEEAALDLLFVGETNRTTAEHQLNKSSNRSHAIFSLHVSQRSRLGSSERVLLSKLNLVDLAGSERCVGARVGAASPSADDGVGGVSPGAQAEEDDGGGGGEGARC